MLQEFNLGDVEIPALRRLLDWQPLASILLHLEALRVDCEFSCVLRPLSNNHLLAIEIWLKYQVEREISVLPISSPLTEPVWTASPS